MTFAILLLLLFIWSLKGQYNTCKQTILHTAHLLWHRWGELYPSISSEVVQWCEQWKNIINLRYQISKSFNKVTLPYYHVSSTYIQSKHMKIKEHQTSKHHIHVAVMKIPEFSAPKELTHEVVVWV